MGMTLLIGKGYIGSAIDELIEVDVVDWKDGFEYDEISEETLKLYDTVILLAGHSSVTQCISDPSGAWINNVEKFKRLLDKIHDQTFIYASSGSLYNNCKIFNEKNTEFNLTNTYDLTKFTIDQLALLSKKNIYGLRFGTVCGYSPKIRKDLMINKMYFNRNSGVIQVSNRSIKRPILGINDLIKAIKTIINNPTNPGIYNLASFTDTVGNIADKVALELNLKIENLPDTPAYNFEMDTSKFRKTYNFTFKESLSSILEGLKNEKLS